MSHEPPALPRYAIRLPLRRFRRLGFFAVVIATTFAGVTMMSDILRANGMTTIEWSILVLFSVTFAWITISFWSAAAGFFLQLFGIDPLSLRPAPRQQGAAAPILARTAVVMPVYNEDTTRVIAGLEATFLSLAATGQTSNFDFYLLSDSTDEEIAAAEEAAWEGLRDRLGERGRLFYRRREDNSGRKAGNIADFCQRWGEYYDYMIVLDADSVMTGSTLLAMVRAMQANPSAGMVQTVPLPVRQETPFGQFLQFAARLYSPMLATGLSFWQMDAANYWGHNAIIGVKAFADHCGLPVLSGRPPLGGEILSHDFVEAALMRRGGWHVYLLPDLKGSYEEVPSNILDFAKRDRRWAQGNLQHLRLLATHGVHPLSRLHFILGALAYMSSLLWLLMLGFSTADALIRALSGAQFFSESYQLYPNWPIAKTGMITSLLSITIGMLLAPKLGGLLLCLGRRDERRGFGGGLRLTVSVVVETLFSVLIAPIMMTFHAYFVVLVLLGRNVPWSTQSRSGRMVPFTEAVRRTFAGTVVGAAWAASTYIIAPVFFWWLTPVVVGLVLAVPVIMGSSVLGLGHALHRWGLFLTPEESEPPIVLQTLTTFLRSAEASGCARLCRPPNRLPPPLLPERGWAMPAQRLDGGAHWNQGRVRVTPS